MRLVRVEEAEERGELHRRIERQTEGELAAVLRERLSTGHVLHHPRNDVGGAALRAGLEHRQRVAEAEARLEEDGRADAAKFAHAHHGDAVAEHVRLVHVVRGEQ